MNKESSKGITHKANDWTQWKVSVDDVESETDLDFLSNLPDEVENRIEKNKDFQQYDPSLSVSLLANSNSFLPYLSPPPDFQTFLEDSIRHNGVVKSDTLYISDDIKFSSSEIGFGEVSTLNFGTEKVSSHQVSPSEIDFREISPRDISPFQNSPLHNSTFEIGSSEISIPESSTSQNSSDTKGIGQISSTEIGGIGINPNQNSFNQIGILQDSIHQVGFSQISPTQISPTQIGTIETGISQISPTQISTDKFGILQDSIGQINSTEFSTTQVSIPQIDSRELNVSQTDFSQASSTEIPLASSISSEQLLSSHNNSTSYNFDNSLTANLSSEGTEILNPLSVNYDSLTNTATLNFNALEVGEYELIIDGNLRNPEGIEIGEDHKVDFTAVSDFSALVDLEFTNTRSHRGNGTVSFDVSLTNQTDYNILLPLNLLLQPENDQSTAEPIDSIGRSDTGAYLIDLSDSVPDGVRSPIS